MNAPTTPSPPAPHISTVPAGCRLRRCLETPQRGNLTSSRRQTCSLVKEHIAADSPPAARQAYPTASLKEYHAAKGCQAEISAGANQKTDNSQLLRHSTIGVAAVNSAQRRGKRTVERTLTSVFWDHRFTFYQTRPAPRIFRRRCRSSVRKRRTKADDGAGHPRRASAVPVGSENESSREVGQTRSLFSTALSRGYSRARPDQFRMGRNRGGREVTTGQQTSRKGIVYRSDVWAAPVLFCVYVFTKTPVTGRKGHSPPSHGTQLCCCTAGGSWPRGPPVLELSTRVFEARSRHVGGSSSYRTTGDPAAPASQVLEARAVSG